MDKPNIDIFREIILLTGINHSLQEGTIGKIDSLKFSINANDHYPPHVHVMRGNQTIARIDLETYEPMKGSNISSKDQKKTVDWLKDNNKGGELIKYFINHLDESVTVYIYKDVDSLIYYSYEKPRTILLE